MQSPVVGSYRLVQKLGEGGMGEVFLAEHTMLGRRAAVKVLRSEFSHRADIVARFFNEARAATAISDPGIVQIFDFGQTPDGHAYIVMELLEGEPLDRRLSRSGVLPIPDALRLTRQVATSLATAHSRGIVHRDLKPENIFIVRDAEVAGGERAKILDFGIAKLYGDQHVKTHTSAVMGTPTYMSPEQCRGSGQVDHRADIYSLGCVLYQLVTGHAPFEAAGSGDLIAMHLREAAPAPSTKASFVPAALDRLVLRCLAKNPDERFQTGTELASAITTLLDTGTLPQMATHTAPTVALKHTPIPTTLSAATGAVAMSMPPPAKKRGGGLVIGLAGLVVGGGIVAVIALQGGGDTAPAAAVQPPVQQAVPPPPTLEPAKVEPPTIDAAVEPPKVDAAVEPAKTVDATKTERPKPKSPKQPPKSPKAPKAPTSPTSDDLDTDGDGIPDKRR